MLIDMVLDRKTERETGRIPQALQWLLLYSRNDITVHRPGRWKKINAGTSVSMLGPHDALVSGYKLSHVG